MAKKRKRQEEKKEEMVYKPPEFDRREYVKTEVSASKATIIAAVFSIPMGLIAMFIMPAGGPGGGLLAGLAGIGILWFLLPRAGIEVAPFKPMQWVGIMSTYFLVFLMVWIVLCNPPFNDLAAPDIRAVQAGWDDGAGNITWNNATVSGLNNDLQVQVPANVSVIISVRVTDNVRVEPGSVRIARGSSDPVNMAGPQERDGIKFLFSAEFSNLTNGESFTIMARDIYGNDSELNFTVLTQDAASVP